MGATTPIGRNLWSSAAAARAGLTGFMQHPVMADREGRPVQVAMFPWLSHRMSVTERIVVTLADAIAEALHPLVGVTAASPPAVALLVNLPLPRAGLAEDVASVVRQHLTRVYPKAFTGVAVAQLGHAGALVALESGLVALDGGRIDACVIAGADSYMDLETLEWLEDTSQLHGAGARNHAWGFIPGEAAGAALVVSPHVAERYALTPLGHLLSVGTGTEPHVIRTESVCLGRGLTDAFRAAFRALDSSTPITDIYCDMNGEPYRADEYGFAVTRTREHFVSPAEFTAPADCWGDVGAASVPLSLGLALAAFAKGYARGGTGLVWASSDTGERGAALVAGG